MQNTQVLYLSYDGLTDPLGQSQILPYLIGLSKHEYEFSIVSFEKPQAYAALSKEIRAICGENNINWTPLTYHKNPPVLSTLYDIWQLWKQVKRIHQRKKVHIVHCRSYITSLVGLRAKRKWHVKFIFDMRGFWADERVEGGLWNLRNSLYKSVYDFFKRKEKRFLIEADYVVSLTHNAKKEIESWGITNAPVAVIPTCVDLELFDPKKIKKEDQVSLRTTLGISENDFVLLYLGSWGTWYLTEKMLDFFSLLKKSLPKAKFLIVSPDNINLGRYADREDVIVTRSSRRSVPTHISLADLSVCFIRPSFSKKASSATKFGEILAMQCAVVTNGMWGDVDLFAQTETGILKIDLQNMKLPELSQVDKQPHSRVFAKNYFSLDGAVAAYQRIYKLLEGA